MSILYGTHAKPIIDALRLKKSTPDEYVGACPQCGGDDRFRISNYNGELKHFCRKNCNFVQRHKILINRGLLPKLESAIQPYHFVKQLPLLAAKLQGNHLIVPLRDVLTGERLGHQTIMPNGKKLFSKGLKKAQAGALVGEPTETLYVCEGWATAVAVHISTGQQALFALDAKTLPKLVKKLKHPNIVIAADHDTEGCFAAEATGKPWVIPSIEGSDWWDVYNIEGKSAVATRLQNVNLSKPLRLFNHVLDISLEPPKWLIDGILPEYAMTALVAPAYVGKTYLAIDIACSIATGHKWQNKHKVTAGNVFYVAGEGRFGIRRRVEAWYRDRDIPLERETTNLHFSRQSLNLRDPNCIALIKADLRLVDNVKLIIIDTLARSFGGGNENAPQDMGEFIQACDELMHEFGATVLIIHHMGKDAQSGARGHSSFFGALDTSMTLKKIGDHDIQLTCEKQKDAPEFDELQFAFVTMGGSDDTPVLHMVPTSKTPMGPKLSANEQLALDTYAEATEGRPLICRLHIDEWRPFFLKRHTGDTIKAKNDAFSRARRSLDTKGFLQVDDDFYTLGDKATFGDKQENVARQNHSAGDATDTPF